MAESKDELPVLPEPTLLGTEVSGHVLECYGHTDAAMRAYATEACAAAQSRINALLEEVEALRKDAERYRWLRSQHWDKSTMCVVTSPKSCVKLGSICPSGDLLDFDIDASLSSGSGEVSNG